MIMTYLQKYNLAQHRNPCIEYSKASIEIIKRIRQAEDRGEARKGLASEYMDRLEGDIVTRKQLNARKASLYYVKFNDGLKLNSEPVTLANAKALVKQWEPQFKGLTIEMI